MDTIFKIERIITPWAPVLFGVLIFAPMWAAVMDMIGISLLYDLPNLIVTTLIGLVWGTIAKLRGRWL